MIGRRWFLSRFGQSAAAFGVGASAPPVPRAQSVRWQPARDAKDNWLDEIPGKHRLFFDAQSPAGVRQALIFATNYFAVSRSAYGLGDEDLAVVICLRHWAAPFAFGDAVWTKFGPSLADSIKFTDPETGRAPTRNVFRAPLESFVTRGVRLAVCDMSSHGFSNEIARKTGREPGETYREMVANAIGAARFVPAGIVAVNRAQERGYTIAYTG